MDATEMGGRGTRRCRGTGGAAAIPGRAPATVATRANGGTHRRGRRLVVTSPHDVIGCAAEASTRRRPPPHAAAAPPRRDRSPGRRNAAAMRCPGTRSGSGRPRPEPMPPRRRRRPPDQRQTGAQSRFRCSRGGRRGTARSREARGSWSRLPPTGSESSRAPLARGQRPPRWRYSIERNQ